MQLKPFSCLVRYSFLLLGLLGALTCSADVFADDAIPGSSYKFEADYYGITSKPTKILADLVNTAESWAPGEGPKHSDCSGCLCSTYAGSPSCNADPTKHAIPCFANYDIKDGCGPTWKYYTNRVNYVGYSYVHFFAGDPDPDKNRGRPSCGVGNPCNPGNGNKYEQVTDFTGNNYVPSFTRSYNSTYIEPVSGAPQGRWTHNYDRRLTLVVPRVGSSNYNYVTASRSGGRVNTFYASNTSWASERDVNNALTQTSTGWLYTLKSGAKRRI